MGKTTNKDSKNQKKKDNQLPGKKREKAWETHELEEGKGTARR